MEFEVFLRYIYNIMLSIATRTSNVSRRFLLVKQKTPRTTSVVNRTFSTSEHSFLLSHPSEVDNNKNGRGRIGKEDINTCIYVKYVSLYQSYDYFLSTSLQKSASQVEKAEWVKQHLQPPLPQVWRL